MTGNPSPRPEIDEVNERHFNVRAAVPNHLEVFNNWRRWSDDYKIAATNPQLNVAYGDQPTQTLDIFYPSGMTTAAVPSVLMIHGGYWQAMDKDDISFAARGLNALGVAVVCVNYSLCPAVSLGEIVEEMRLASLWLVRYASKFNIDPDKLAVCGHSAGGHLAALLVCEDWPSRDRNAPVHLYKGCLAISGLFDLEDLLGTTINLKVGLDVHSARALSPIYHAPVSGISVAAVVGGLESDGFHGQSARLAKAWGATATTVGFSVAENSNHFEVFERLTDPNDPMCRILVKWLSKNGISC